MSHTLSDAHRRTLKETSGLTDAVIDARGYYTLPNDEVVAFVADDLYRKEVLKAGGWLAIPVIRPDGVQHCIIIRLDETVDSMPGQKYIWPKGVRNALDVSPSTLQYVRDSSVPLIITEGIKKGDAIAASIERSGARYCVLAINGAWGWKAHHDSVRIAVPDFYDIGFDKRDCILIPDSDIVRNDNVQQGWMELSNYVGSKTESKHLWICVPPNIGTAKQGADDYLLEHSLGDLLAHATTPKQADFSITVPSLDIVSAKEVIDTSSEDIEWLIEKLIPASSIVVMAGHSRAYKTWHALVLALDVITGQLYLNHPQLLIPAPSGVLYINREMGRNLIGARLRNLSEHERYSQIENIDKLLEEKFFIFDDALFDIMDTMQQDMLIDFMIRERIKLCVIDTFSMAWHGDENKANEVGQFYSVLRDICRRSSVSFLLLHHLTKPTRDAAAFQKFFAIRGSGQIGQQADSVLVLDVHNANTDDENTIHIKVVHAKSRAALELPDFITAFRIDPDSHIRLVEYEKLVRDDLALMAAEGGMTEFRQWLLHTLDEQPGMHQDGLRFSSLRSVLTLSWPENLGKPPSHAKLQQGMHDLVASGELVNRNAALGIYAFNPEYIDKLEQGTEND